MIISSTKIRRLIRRIIKEQVGSAYFGNEFLKFKERVADGEPPISVAEDMLVRIGEGSTRVVFGFRDNPTAVLKVVNWVPEIGVDPRTGFEEQQMVDSNKWEADLTMQQKYSDVFPKTFEVADDYSWILSEKVQGLRNFEELKKVVGLEGEEFDNNGWIRKIQFQVLIELAIDYFQKPDSAARSMLSESDLDRTVRIPQNPDETSAFRQVSPKIRRLEKLLSIRQNNKIFAAMGDLEIPPREFLPKNLGVSEITGKLVLLDASLWKPYKPVRPT